MTGPAQLGDSAVADFQDQAWRASRYRGLAVVVMAASTASGPLALWQALSGRPAQYVLALAAIAAVLGLITTERLGRPSWRQRRGLAYRLGEAVLLLSLARVATWALDIGWPTAAALGTCLRAPASFVDGPFLFATATLFIVWGTAISSTSDFLDLALRPDEIAAQQQHGYGDSLSYWRVSGVPARGDILGRFAQRWIWGGVALVVMAATVRVDLQVGPTGLFRAGLRNLGLPPVVLGGLLAYFFAGLLLISDARLAVLRAQWFTQQIVIAPPVLKRWRASSVLLVGLAALLALALPLGTSGWLARALLWLLSVLAWLGMLLYYLLTQLFMLLFYPLRWLTGHDRTTESPPPAPVPVIPTQAEAASQLPDWLGGALVWGVVALVAGYLLWNFLQANGLLTGWPAALARLRNAWRTRRWRFTAAIREQLARLRVRSPHSRSPRPSRSILRFGALAARERVRYYYLLTLRRAAEKGLARPPHETPLEFLPKLTEGWPEAGADVQALTEAFQVARYAAQPIEPQRLHAAHTIWRRVMRALRHPAGAHGARPLTSRQDPDAPD